jgi:hypothetical protein
VTLVNWPQVDYWLTPLIMSRMAVIDSIRWNGMSARRRAPLPRTASTSGRAHGPCAAHRPCSPTSNGYCSRWVCSCTGLRDPNQSAVDHWAVTKPQHRADRFLDPDSDPREGGTSLGDERATLIEFLRGQRLTLQLKCEGLDADQLARRGVEHVDDVAARPGAAPGRARTQVVPATVRGPGRTQSLPVRRRARWWTCRPVGS